MKEKYAIVAGGGPCPGPNSIIAGGICRAASLGIPLIGVVNGFQDMMAGQGPTVRLFTVLEAQDLIGAAGCVLGTTKAYPPKNPKYVANCVSAIRGLGVTGLLVIGGEGTASTARALLEANDGAFSVIQAPKTIDNDVPFPPGAFTPGFHTAVEGTALQITSLLADAQTYRNLWYIAVPMGRSAGHIALDSCVAACAQMVVIPEQLPPNSAFSLLVEILVGAILRAAVLDPRCSGVAVVGEGCLEKIDPQSHPRFRAIPHDENGVTALSRFPFADILSHEVTQRLAELGMTIRITGIPIGYTVRGLPPNAYDRVLGYELGHEAVTRLAQRVSGEIVYRTAARFEGLPMLGLVDPATGQTRVRTVDLSPTGRYSRVKGSIGYLRRTDLQGATLTALAQLTKQPEADLIRMFDSAAAWAESV